MLSVLLWYLFVIGLIASFFASTGYTRDRKGSSLTVSLGVMLGTVLIGIVAVVVTRWG